MPSCQGETVMGMVDGVGGGIGIDGRHARRCHVVLTVHNADQDTDLGGGEKRMVDRRWTHMLHYACLVAVAQLACPSRPYRTYQSVL